MACCLMAPSHYLNQCWLIYERSLFTWEISQELFMNSICNICLKISPAKLLPRRPGASELIKTTFWIWFGNLDNNDVTFVYIKLHTVFISWLKPHFRHVMWDHHKNWWHSGTPCEPPTLTNCSVTCLQIHSRIWVQEPQIINNMLVINWNLSYDKLHHGEWIKWN